jgi:hypothetical protein
MEGEWAEPESGQVLLRVRRQYGDLICEAWGPSGGATSYWGASSLVPVGDGDQTFEGKWSFSYAVVTQKISFKGEDRADVEMNIHFTDNRPSGDIKETYSVVKR